MDTLKAKPRSRMFSVLAGNSRQARLVWFSLSLAFAAFYGVLALRQAFGGEYVVQDDYRQHIFWMYRYVDPDLFPNDLIADYFQGVAPVGYAWLYQIMASVGLEPELFSKILPPILGLVTTGYCFAVCMELFPIPLAGFISSLGLIQSLWCSSELASATPRAFLYPLFVAFLYYFLRKAHIAYLVLLGLQAMFYPQVSLVALGVLVLTPLRFSDGKVSLSRQWRDYWIPALGFCLVAGIVLYTKGLSDFGPVVTRAEAMQMPEFQDEGRNDFFSPGLNPLIYGRAGVFHHYTFSPPSLVAGFLLPILLRLPRRSRLHSLVDSRIQVLLRIVLVSLVLYGLAHLLLFQLHLPNRYTSHTIRMVLAIASGMAWVIILDTVFRIAETWRSRRLTLSEQGGLSRDARRWVGRGLPIAFTGLLFMVIVFFYPIFVKEFPRAGYYDFAHAQPIYEYFSAQPDDSLIASISAQASNIPSISKRSVLVSVEHALAYHHGYYDQIRQRTEDLITAQYTSDPAVVLEFMTTYDVDFWLIDQYAFEDSYVADNNWLQQFQPMADTAVLNLRQGDRPIIQRAMESCAVLQTPEWTVLETGCVAQFAAARAGADVQ